MLGRPREQLEGQSLLKLAHADDEHLWRAACNAALAEGPAAFTLELRLKARDGAVVWARVNASLVTDDRGEPLYFTSQIEDVTTRKLEDERMRRELRGVTWVGRLRDALDRDQLVLHAQPIVDLATGAAIQEELLLRMIGPDGELIAPAFFLPAAEEYGLIQEVDRWVLRRAALLAAAGRRVQVNLSAHSLAQRDLSQIVEEELASAGADPSLITFELTETAVVGDLDDANLLASRLHELGCGFALDDFGTGYGSFTSLKNLPISYLKIDKEFVRELQDDAANRAVVEAVVGLAHGLGQRTIAEGVENDETLQTLRQCGVDYAQGFLLGRPAPADRILDRPPYGKETVAASLR
jgi:PAS domain S-box-containing protein